MGKKHNNRNQSKTGSKPVENKLPNHVSKLSPQKRNELNTLIDKLLKVTSNVATAQNSTKNWELHLEIDKILAKIIKLESDVSFILPTRDVTCAQQLTSWMEENGSKLNGIEIADFGDLGFGLRATKDLKENELIITVPRKIMLTSGKTHSDLGDLVSTDPMLQHMPNVTLAIFLLIERFKKDSLWSSYIKMLPSKYNTVMYFTPEELKELKGSPTYEAALKQCKNIARQYAYFYNLFQSRTDLGTTQLRDVFTYEHYRWAVSTVMTRQNYVPSKTEGESKVHALIPFWDMANHTNGKITTDYNDEKEESLCFACQDFNSGDQVLISYGARSNHDLLIHNGFVFPDNIHDSLMFSLGISRSDPLYNKRYRLLDILGLPSSGQHSITVGSRPIREPLLAFLRVFCMDEENLDKWLTNEQSPNLGQADCAVDTCVDKKVWEFLMMRIKLLLAAYTTKLEEDEKLSSKKDMTSHQRLAITQRMIEKKILTNTLEVVNDYIKA